MSRSASPGSVERGWDGPWYQVRTDAFEASFLPSPDEELDSVCNLDLFVDLKDGSRWSATVFTVAEVERLMQTWAGSGEALGGRYSWCSDGLIVRDPGIDSMTHVIAGGHPPPATTTALIVGVRLTPLRGPRTGPSRRGRGAPSPGPSSSDGASTERSGCDR
ncbi:hypothetical protein [Streptomyces sp. A1547]|uniref:hypothetical protein n=1 Tax=Streptomyces sp. A1547 TaxID=2563105 RepID=UPI001F0CF575|nr:hypothetical protein [Streptomyces sp. A1547]